MHAMLWLIRLVTAMVIGGTPRPGDTMPADIHANIHHVAKGLREAMRQGDVEAVRRKAQELREALDDWAGVPERRPRFRAPPDAKTQLSDQQIAALWDRAWQDAEAEYGGEGRWGLPGGDHPEVRHSLLRRTAYVVMGGLAALKHGTGDRGLVRRRVKDGLAYLRSVQRPDGVFPFPDARNWSKSFRWLLDAHYDVYPESFVDGWVVKDTDEGGLQGGLQFDNGVCAVTMITAFEQLRDRRCRESARRACEWAVAQPVVLNWNYNAFSVWALARYMRVTGDQEFLAPAIQKLRLGVLPGQLPGGRWMDPHNARTVYHAIILRAMTELYAVLPKDEPIRARLRDAIQRAERVLVDEICTRGATDADHSLSALCAVERVFGPEPRRSDAIRTIVNAMYRQIVEPRVKCLHDVTLFAVRQVLERAGRTASTQPARQ